MHLIWLVIEPAALCSNESGEDVHNEGVIWFDTGKIRSTLVRQARLEGLSRGEKPTWRHILEVNHRAPRTQEKGCFICTLTCCDSAHKRTP